MGQKRKPWSPEEDKVLIDFITNHGHENWRVLPKQTGLLRCGRSCRFRWLNYLRHDIKRGNFSIEEEEEIIKLHESLGNKWSAIAARVPGRTDNEIKNAWNTRLKKKLKKNNTSPGSPEYRQGSKCETSDSGEGEPVNSDAQLDPENLSCDTLSPPQSPSEFSSGTDTSSSMATVNNQGMSREDEYYASSHHIFHVDENFSTDSIVTQQQTCYFPNRSNMNDNTDFWLDLYLNAREQPVSGLKNLAEDRIDNSDIRLSPKEDELLKLFIC